MIRYRGLIFAAIVGLVWTALAFPQGGGRFTFAILGDRTGEAQPGVYEQIWREVAAERPVLAISVGDSIQGLGDAGVEREWTEVERIWKAHSGIPFYLTPGNHDILSAATEAAFRKHSGHAPRYSFDYQQAHFTVLDNSRTEELSGEELDFLENDLKAHAAAPIKLIFSHRPSWVMDVGFRNADFRLHKLARQYGVQYVVAGHIHQMLRFELEGITYLSVASSGGHLRLSQAYQDGWFFGHARVDMSGKNIDMQIEESKPPYGQGRVTRPQDWGMAGLVVK